MPMAISQSEYSSYDHDRMIVRFTLMDGDVKVACAISTAAMDDLDQRKDTRATQREEQFLRLRERIEAQAAVKIGKLEFEGTPRGIVLRSIDFRARS
jgi:hypothetical protein